MCQRCPDRKWRFARGTASFLKARLLTQKIAGRFNGFYSDHVVEVMDAPQMSLFPARRISRVKEAA
jgi:hypothetical protein